MHRPLYACTSNSYYAEAALNKFQTPSWELPSRLSKAEYSFESAVINAHRKAIFLKVGAEEEFLLYYFFTFAMRCFIPLFSVHEQSRLMINSFRRSVLLFVQKNTGDLDIAYVCF